MEISPVLPAVVFFGLKATQPTGQLSTGLHSPWAPSGFLHYFFLFLSIISLGEITQIA